MSAELLKLRTDNLKKLANWVGKNVSQDQFDMSLLRSRTVKGSLNPFR